MSDWINYMSITKYKVHKKTGQVQHISGFTKMIGADKAVAGRPKAKKVKIDYTVDEGEEI